MVEEKRVTPESVRRANLNPTIDTDVELKGSIFTPQTGRSKITQGFDDFYQIRRIDKDNEAIFDPAWDGFASVTSDTRSSNLDPSTPEYDYVKWAMKMQLLCVQGGLPSAAAMAQALAFAQTEPSLAKNMAFLKSIQTIRQESQHLQIEDNAKSRSIFGKIKDKLNM